MSRELGTDHLVLRPVNPSDAPAIYDAFRDPAMARSLTGIPDPYTQNDAEAFVGRCAERWRAGTSYTFAITDNGTGDLLGVIELGAPDDGRSEVGYWVRREARGRGVATEALQAIARFAFGDLGVERLALTTHPENAASQRVAEKAGFQREGILRAHLRFREGRRDSVLFSLLPSDLD